MSPTQDPARQHGLAHVGGDALLRNKRLTQRIARATGDIRTEARRDRDRILYSQAWRRLGGVTQVITPFEDIGLIHTRLTHSEKVGQVARSIAETMLATRDAHDLIVELGGLDADVVEAAALAHDLGHSPFGHIGEQTLDEIARTPEADGGLGLADGFEGNAQSLRIVLVNEVRSPEYDGLDLTAATYAAIAKYPWGRADALTQPQHNERLQRDTDYRRKWRKFSAYKSELPVLVNAREFLPSRIPSEAQSLEASIMDAADDITYAVHDLEDFYLAGMLDVRAVLDELEGYGSSSARGTSGATLTRLAERLQVDYPSYFDEQMFEEGRTRVLTQLRLGLAPSFDGDPLQVGRARKYESDWIGQYLRAVHIHEDPVWSGGPHVAIDRPAWHDVQILKEITRSFVVTRPDIALLQRGQQEVLRGLIRHLSEWMNHPTDRERLPRRLRTEIRLAEDQRDGKTATGYGGKSGEARLHAPRGEPNRCLLDFLCTLTDGQCVALFRKLSGHRLAASALDVFA